MNNKYDLKSMRFIAILLFICLVFIGVVWQAFQYLPSDDINQNESQITVPGDDFEVNSDESADEDAEMDDEEGSDDDADVSDEEDNEGVDEDVTESAPQEVAPQRTEPDKKFDVIENPEELTSNDVDSLIDGAIKSRESKNYVAAINGYEGAIKATGDPIVKAECYEQISTIYAAMKKYESALGYAQRAYNLSPTSSRELLLAKLNYKTGNVDKANGQLKDVLNRDITFDE